MSAPRFLRAFAGALAVAVMLFACSPSDEDGVNCAEIADDPEALCVAVDVLVDLSATWHNANDEAVNERLLRTVGGSLVAAAADLYPIKITYRIIGEQSLGRPPICRVIYRQSSIGGLGGNEIVIARRLGEPRPGQNTLQNFLQNDCPSGLLMSRMEDVTLISSAVKTSSESMSQYDEQVAQRIIILSDMKEEPPQPLAFENVDLTGVDILLLYRTLSEDQERPAERDRRLDEWTSKLENAGARVIRMDDTDPSNYAIGRFLRAGAVR